MNKIVFMLRRKGIFVFFI